MNKDSIKDIQPRKRLLKEVLNKSDFKSSENLSLRKKKVPSSSSTNKKPDAPKRNTSSGGKLLWLLVLFCGLFLSATILESFSRVEIIITPNEKNFTIDETFSAKSAVSDGSIIFQTMKLSGEVSKNIPVEETETISKRAEGTVVLFNAYSSSPQKLLIETRLESPDGLIYKTKKAVTVPGFKTEGGQKIPGSLEVEVFADQPGADYNQGLTDFKIVGFKGRPQYDTFYGRSKTEISGGMSGLVASIDQEDRDLIEEELASELKTTLFEKAELEIPESFIAFKEAVFLESELSEELNDDSSSTEFKESGELTIVLFERKNLEQIIKDTLEEDDIVDFFIPEIKNLEFSLVNNQTNFSSTESFDFNLQGDGRIVFLVDKESLINELVSKKKNTIGGVFEENTSIKNASVSIKPFWKQTLPDNKEDFLIDYTIETPNI